MSALDDDLLPCPHCGSPAKSYHRPDATGWQNTDWICCDSDDDGVEPNCGAQTCLHSSREAAVAAWNRRTSAGYTIVRKDKARDEDYDDEGKAALSALEATPPAPTDDDGSMTPEEIRLENLKQMAAYDGPVVSFDVREPYYLASCDHCGWVGSTELCGTDSYGDDSDVYCPRCHASGADCGKVAARIATPPAPKVTEADMDDAAVAALVALARHNIPTDVQELLVRGDPMRSIPPGALSKSFADALQTFTAAQEAGKP